jgi:exopolysaccharide production protein ExoZ
MMKIESIQLLRAVAAWMVVFHHYMQLGYGKDYSTFLGEFFREHGAFGVDIFFVVSGFIMYYTISSKNYSVRSFLIGRLTRIVPAYWAATMALLVVALVYKEVFSWTEWSFKSLALSLLFIPNVNPSGIGTFPFLTVGWTLNIEMFFYATLGFCLVFGSRWRFWVCGIFLGLVPFIWQRFWIYGDVLGNLKLVEFVIGLIISYAYFRWSKALKWTQDRLSIALLPLIFSISVLYWDGYGARTFGASGLVITGLCLEQAIVSDRTWLSRLSAHLGDLSYSTYLFHPIIIPIAFYYYGLPNNVVSESVLICICVAAVYIVSKASFVVIEKSNFINGFGKRLSAPQSIG